MTQLTATSAGGADLLTIIDRFKGARVMVYGDLILDHYIWGKVNRISPEAPVVVVEVTEESKRPGGAGNVANNLAALGARPVICGVVGDDEWGRSLLTLLEYMQADIDGVMVDRSRPTTVKTRVIASAQQVVRVDREIAQPLSPTYSEGLAASFEAKIGDCQGIIVSDYAKGTIGKYLFDRVEGLHQRGMIGWGSKPLLIDPKAPNYPLYKRATVIKPNRKEAEEATHTKITDRASAMKAGEQLLTLWDSDMVLITLGEHGMVLASRLSGQEHEVEIDTVARDVFDVSGAGDTVSAVFSLALSVGATPRQAAQLANHAAGIVVGEVGTVAVSAAELRDAVASGTIG